MRPTDWTGLGKLLFPAAVGALVAFGGQAVTEDVPAWVFYVLAAALFVAIWMLLGAWPLRRPNWPAELSYYRQSWNALRTEYDRIKGRLGTDPQVVAFMHKVTDVWAEMRAKIAKGQLPKLGHPFDEDLTFEQLTATERTKFEGMLKAAIENIDHAAATI